MAKGRVCSKQNTHEIIQNETLFSKLENSRCATTRGYVGREQLPVFSTVSIFDLTGFRDCVGKFEWKSEFPHRRRLVFLSRIWHGLLGQYCCPSLRVRRVFRPTRSHMNGDERCRGIAASANMSDHALKKPWARRPPKTSGALRNRGARRRHGGARCADKCAAARRAG